MSNTIKTTSPLYETMVAASSHIDQISLLVESSMVKLVLGDNPQAPAPMPQRATAPPIFSPDSIFGTFEANINALEARLQALSNNVSNLASAIDQMHTMANIDRRRNATSIDKVSESYGSSSPNKHLSGKGF